jgi:hypothetical protein
METKYVNNNNNNDTFILQNKNKYITIKFFNVFVVFLSVLLFELLIYLFVTIFFYVVLKIKKNIKL